MSVSLLTLAKGLGKNQRSIRRWCELGIIPGAYRSKGGHWRVRRFKLREQLKVIERVKKFARVRSSLPKNNQILFDKEAWQWLADGGWEKLTKANALLLSAYGLDHQTSLTEKLPNDLRRLLCDTPIHKAISQKMFSAAQLGQADLHKAARLILSRSPSGNALSAKALARELKMSRATLYRKFLAKDIQAALESSHEQSELPRERTKTGLKPKV
jgi:hypothetical protein